MKIALIRHGLTEWNALGRVQGTVDTELSAVGRAQMALLRPPDGFEKARAFVSPKKRARQTAALLGLASAVIDERLREQNWGIWEGLTRAEMAARYGAGCFDKAGIGIRFRPPGGEASFEMMARVKDFLLDVGKGANDAVAVAHMGVLRTAYALATGRDMVGTAPELDLKTALVLRVTDAVITVAALNVPLGRKAEAV